MARAASYVEPIQSDLEGMNILEFESRVKRYASISNMGYISPDQLLEAFKGTPIFGRIKDSTSVAHKFLLSPFVAYFPIGSQLDVE